MIVGVVATMISVYYYLAVVRAVLLRAPVELQLQPAGGSPPPSHGPSRFLSSCG